MTRLCERHRLASAALLAKSNASRRKTQVFRARLLTVSFLAFDTQAANDPLAQATAFLSGPAAHSALSPAGAQAARIHDLWQLTLWICMGVFAAILVALLVALVRAPARVRGARP
jgi:cytochrome c oxidase subunit 2